MEIVDSVKSSVVSQLYIYIINFKAQKLVGLLFQQFYRCADMDIVRKLYIAIVRPHLEYAGQFWMGSISAGRTNKLLKTVKNVLVKQV